jgi:coenzyme F420-0:L-glutamate ligase/coenzyme F420-1:gamma-L-glutamate ligase
MSGEEVALAVIGSRRSIRAFSAKAIPPEVVDSVIDAGRRAPSPHNTQPWVFVVISGEDRRNLAGAMRSAHLRYLRSQGDGSAKEKSDRAYSHAASVPLLLLLCLDTSALRTQPTRARRRGEWLMGSQGVAAAAENMLLAAHANGLGGCWRGAPIFCASAVRRALELPASLQPQVLLELGYPAGKPKRKMLKPRDEVVRNGIHRRHG